MILNAVVDGYNALKHDSVLNNMAFMGKPVKLMRKMLRRHEKSSKKLKEYDLDDILNADETGLFYVRGKKRNKATLTIMLCTNATGSFKMRRYVIGKTKRPRCFGKTFQPENIGVKYLHNKKAWQTGITFYDWIMELNQIMNRQGRNVDNATSHTF